MTFSEQRALLFQDADLLYARSVSGMITGRLPVLRTLLGLGYRTLLRFPTRMLDGWVEEIARIIRWRSRTRYRDARGASR